MRVTLLSLAAGILMRTCLQGRRRGRPSKYLSLNSLKVLHIRMNMKIAKANMTSQVVVAAVELRLQPLLPGATSRVRRGNNSNRRIWKGQQKPF